MYNNQLGIDKILYRGLNKMNCYPIFHTLWEPQYSLIKIIDSWWVN